MSGLTHIKALRLLLHWLIVEYWAPRTITTTDKRSFDIQFIPNKLTLIYSVTLSGIIIPIKTV